MVVPQITESLPHPGSRDHIYHHLMKIIVVKILISVALVEEFQSMVDIQELL